MQYPGADMFKMTLGRVKGVDGQGISTRFFAFVGPLVPLGSVFVAAESFSRQGNVSTHSMQVVPVRWHLGSIVLGYLRVWLVVGAFAMPFILMWGELVDFSRPEMLWTPGLLIAWGLTFLFGRAGAEEKRYLRQLGQATGLRMDPRWLDPFERTVRREEIARRASFMDLPLKEDMPSDTARKLATLEPEQLYQAFAFACYTAPDNTEWQAVADAAHKMLPEPPAA